jgi:hypothetical protein
MSRYHQQGELHFNLKDFATVVQSCLLDEIPDDGGSTYL